MSYSNAAKTALLGVPAELIAAHGAVSPEVARAMADGARAALGADVGIGITGVAGPDGGTPAKPVGYVCLCATTGVRGRRRPRPYGCPAVAPTSATAPSTPACTCCCAPSPADRAHLRAGSTVHGPTAAARRGACARFPPPGAGYARPASAGSAPTPGLARGEGEWACPVNRRQAWSPGAPARPAVPDRRPARPTVSATASRSARTSRAPPRSRWPRRWPRSTAPPRPRVRLRRRRASPPASAPSRPRAGA